MNFVKITKNNYEQVAQIYAFGIQTGLATFETQVPEYKYWNKNHTEFARLALMEKGVMVGWGALSYVSQRKVYQGVCEISVYIAQSFQRQGFGKIILKQLIEESEKNGIWTLQSAIMPENISSIALHKSCGFREIGYRERVAKLQGVWTDNILMERRSDIIGIHDN